MDYTYLDQNLARVREELARACGSGGYSPEGVTLMAAIKSADVEEINYLHTVLGVNFVGENRVQQLLERYDRLEKEGLSIHFIGTLQRNKVKYIIDKVDMIQSLDSDKLADEIEKQAAKHGIVMDVLAEINSGLEESKSGLCPDEVEDFCRSLSEFPHIRLRGFMTMAPKCEKKEDYHKYFQKTYLQCLDIWQKKLHNIGRPVLSMGMSESFEVAIEEGSSMVRIGRALFAEPQDESL